MADEVVVATAQFGALPWRHVLETQMREIGLPQSFDIAGAGGGITAASVPVSARHGVTIAEEWLRRG